MSARPPEHSASARVEKLQAGDADAADADPAAQGIDPGRGADALNAGRRCRAGDIDHSAAHGAR